MMPIAWSITARLSSARCSCFGPLARAGQQLRVVHRHRRRPGELRTQLHGVLAERVAVVGIGVDRADHLVADHQRQRQRRVHAHPRHPAAEARPAVVAAQRSADGGPPGLHARDARPLVELVVLDGVDLVDELRGGRPRLDARCRRRAASDQRDAGAVDAGNGLDGELARRRRAFRSTPRAPATIPATPLSPACRSISSASSCAADRSGCGGGCDRAVRRSRPW